MSFMPEMDADDVLRVRLGVMRQEHRDLDEELSTLSYGARGNTLLVSRLKKRKLKLKDLIARFEDRLMPDIIA